MSKSDTPKFVRQFFDEVPSLDLKFEPSITVPDLSFSIKEIMDQYGRGMLDINLLKAQQRDESLLALGIYDLSDYSAAMKETKANFEKALADKQRIEAALLSMQQQADAATAQDIPPASSQK